MYHPNIDGDGKCVEIPLMNDCRVPTLCSSSAQHLHRSAQDRAVEALDQDDSGCVTALPISCSLADADLPFLFPFMTVLQSLYDLLEHPNPDDPLVASIVSCGRLLAAHWSRAMMDLTRRRPAAGRDVHKGQEDVRHDGRRVYYQGVCEAKWAQYVESAAD